MTPYPTRDKIEEIFSDRDIPEIFHSYLADHIDVEVPGEGFHMSGKYKTIEEFHKAMWARGSAICQDGTIHMEVHRVIGGGDSAWAAVYATCSAIALNGQ